MSDYRDLIFYQKTREVVKSINDLIKTWPKTIFPSSPIPSFDFGGTSLPLHFLHANGYPPECYRLRLERPQEVFEIIQTFLKDMNVSKVSVIQI